MANVALPNVFGDNAVLQRGMEIPVWGFADPGETVHVLLDGKLAKTTADDQGNWMVKLPKMEAGGPHSLVVEGQKNRIERKNILIGEVWVCSGQSNMEWPVSAMWNADLTIATAKYPNIRLLTVDTAGQQKSVKDYPGNWKVCSPETVGDFSATGFFFGRMIHQMIDVPIGLIDNSWGGSSAEAWVRRDLMEGKELYEPLLKGWAEREAKPKDAETYAKFEKEWADWTDKVIAAKKAGTELPSPPRRPRGTMFNQHRPANLYHARIKPIMPYGIRGAIWYQGESNAGRAYQYRDMFPLMIKNWRDDWGQGDFPFYWVQLADFRNELPDPGESEWAELREAQTMTMDKLTNTGEAVIIDIGEGSDIHPKNKLDVGIRLARWALAHQYGMTDLIHQSPRYKSMEKADGKIVITFDHVGNGLRTVDRREVQGFAISGEDKQWVWAKARIVPKTKDQVEVWSDEVQNPVAVRYAWADNPVCNLYNRTGLPVTPFRTDDWPGLTVDAR